MKEFKEDKLELQDKVKTLIKEFNNKYDVIVEDVYLCYMGMPDNKYIKVEINVKL